jgi:chemotaxis protein CheX
MASTQNDRAVGEDTVRQFVETIWSSMLKLEVSRAEAAGPPWKGRRHVTGLIHITGSWEGTITLACSSELARRAGATMFGIDPVDATDEEIKDAIGELTNMTGGNVKNLLEGSCQLSLPSVTEGVDYTISVPGSRLTSAVHFECEGEPLVVSVLEKRFS